MSILLHTEVQRISPESLELPLKIFLPLPIHLMKVKENVEGRALSLSLGRVLSLTALSKVVWLASVNEKQASKQAWSQQKFKKLCTGDCTHLLFSGTLCSLLWKQVRNDKHLLFKPPCLPWFVLSRTKIHSRLRKGD